MPFQVAVTYLPNKGQRQVIHSVLDDIAEIRYLPDLADQDRVATLERAEVILAKSFAMAEMTPHDVALLKKARLVQLIFAGADNTPFASIPENITVASNAGAFASPLAEHVLAMTLCLAKSILPRHRQLAKGNFERSGFSKELKGGVCGIIGLGGNGDAIARLMKKMGMQVQGINRSATSTCPLDFIGTPGDMDNLLQTSDVVVLTVPLTRETRHLIGQRELKLMKPDAILINVARGKVIDQEALFAHLKVTSSFGVGIDTWWSEPGMPGGFTLDYPFFDLPNVVGSPHNADHVKGSMAAATKAAAENIRSFLKGRDIKGVINRMDYV